MAEPDLQKRLVELEVQVAFHEDHIQKLSDMLYQQQRRLDSLGEELHLSNQRLLEIQRGVGETTPKTERPPHY